MKLTMPLCHGGDESNSETVVPVAEEVREARCPIIDLDVIANTQAVADSLQNASESVVTVIGSKRKAAVMFSVSQPQRATR